MMTNRSKREEIRKESREVHELEQESTKGTVKFLSQTYTTHLLH